MRTIRAHTGVRLIERNTRVVMYLHAFIWSIVLHTRDYLSTTIIINQSIKYIGKTVRLIKQFYFNALFTNYSLAIHTIPKNTIIRVVPLIIPVV